MGLYASLDKFKVRLINKTDPASDEELTDILGAVSRSVDDYLEVEEDYFTPPSAPSMRTVKGTGSTFIQLPAPVYGSVTITASSGYTVPNFTVIGMRLVTLDTNDNPAPFIKWQPIFYNVTGSWGYAAVPEQLREATLQVAVHFWRGRDKALGGVINNLKQDEAFPERNWPQTARTILDKYKLKLQGKAEGGLYFA